MEKDTLPLELGPEVAGEPVGAPESIPVPVLDAQAPEDEIVGLAASGEVPDGHKTRGRPYQSPLIPGETKLERKRRMSKERHRRRRIEGKRPKGKPAPGGEPLSTDGPRRAPGVPLPGELELEGFPELLDGTTREELDQLAGALGLAFGMGAGLAATRYGAHWELSESEAGKLGSAWAVVLAPYLGGMGAAAPWVTAVLVTAGIAAPRVVLSLATPAGEPELEPIVPPAPEPESALVLEGRPVRVSGPAAPTGGNQIKPPKRK